VNFMSCTGASQSNFSTGIENVSGNMGLQPLMTQPAPMYTVKYYYPPNTSYLVVDATVSWNGNDDNGGIFIPNQTGPYPLTTEIMNQGNVNLPQLDVTGKVTDLAGNVLVSDLYQVPAGLVPSQTALITFPNAAYSPTTLGTKRYVTSIAPVFMDSIPVNDSIIQEIVVVDTTQQTIRLCYTDNHVNPVLSSISWNGGQGGVGVYVAPASYPARIVSTNFICATSPASGIAFYAKVFDDDGPNGTPGTLLDSVAVMGQSIVPYQVITVPLSNAITINSGGVYVEWEMATTTVAIAQDLTPPFSRQTYEVFSIYWSTYRDYQNCDFFIGADYQKAFPEDVGVTQIVSPANNSTVAGPTNVSCWIKNYGNYPDNYNIMVNYKILNNPPIVSQAYSGPLIQPGDSAFFTFSTQLGAPYSGTDVLLVWTSKPSDAILSNDTASNNLTLVGVEELSPLQGVSVYPVPAAEQVSFAFSAPTNDAVIITVTDVSGRVVSTVKHPQANAGSVYTLDVTAFAPGTYFYTITSGDKEGNGKLVIAE
ncbi:MAG TPA: T9SS type A sorting domain-containing protein, partial [Bacteroidia bacterium]|nr:T9SS type A sorting domain-containing protein [Bacteroidia bacterium]